MGVEKPTSVLDVSSEGKISHRRKLYSLQEGVYLVPGAQRAAVCDTNTGNVYSINAVAKNILLGQEENEGFVNNMKQANLSNGENAQLVEKEQPKFQLEFVWFEIISDDCNERCLHCYADSMPPTYRKLQEGKTVSKQLPMFSPKDAESEEQKQNFKLTADRWKELIKETYDLGNRSCQFIGGEPFLWRGESRETVIDLAEYAKQLGYEQIEIFTNATMVTPRDIERIKQLGLNIAVSLYSSDEAVHDSITRTPGSFRKTIKTLERLRDVGIPTRVETVLMKQNEGTIDTTNEFIANMGFSHRPPDVLRPKGRGGDVTIEPSAENSVKHGLMLGPNFSAPSGFFHRSVLGNNCLAGKITITENGLVLPCIFSRDKPIGMVRKQNLEEVLDGKIKSIWKTTKDDVLVCQDCEYRYVCFDCRPMSQGASQGIGDYKTAPYPRCTYDPYRGE